MTHEGHELPPIRDAAAFQAAFGVPRETIERLEIYERILRRWQANALNLVAPSTLDLIWHRHFADSAQLVAQLSADCGRLLDIGSGAGFPGLVLAIVLAGDPARAAVRITLIDSDQRKAAFLREVARAVAIPVDISGMRVENPETRAKVGSVDVVTARALAPLGRLLSLAAPYFADGATGLFLKGREVESELEAARADWQLDVVLRPSLTDPGGRIAVVRDPRPLQEGRAATGPAKPR